jgi:CAAX prenyl protease-like protein
VRVAPFAVIAGLAVLRNRAPDVLLLGWDARWLEAVSLAIATGLLWFWRREYTELAPIAWPSWGECALGAITGALVFSCSIRLDQPWMRLGEATLGYRPVDADGDIVLGLLAVRLLWGALVVPLASELCWRSFVMRRLEAAAFDVVAPQRVRPKAALLSALLFALVSTQWLSAFVAGLAYAWLYRRSGSLWTAVIAHTVAFVSLGVWVVALGTWGFW